MKLSLMYFVYFALSFRLSTQVFQSWRTFVSLQKEEKIKLKHANLHGMALIIIECSTLFDFTISVTVCLFFSTCSCVTSGQATGWCGLEQLGDFYKKEKENDGISLGEEQTLNSSVGL